MPDNTVDPAPWPALTRIPVKTVHSPRRSSDVEAWLKDWRDRYGPGPVWRVLDDLLDDYRLRADTGLSMSADIADAGQCGGTW